MTVKEIAQLAGTSRGTVDRVLNGRGNVSPDIEKRVREIAEQYNYQPNQLARALINSRNRIHIGVVISSLGNPFFDDVLKGIKSSAKKLASYGVELEIRETKGYVAQEQIDAIHELTESGIDGLAIMPINVPAVAQTLRSLGIPIVTFNNDIDIPKLAFVGCDYYNSGCLSGDMAKLLLPENGRAAAVIGSFTIEGHMQRVRGFVDVLSQCAGARVVAQAENEDDDDTSYRVVKRLIEEREPDLIYFGAGGIAGGIKAVLESGRKIKILTVDDTEIVRKYLSDGTIAATVTQQPYYQGENTIKLLFDYLSSGKAPKEVNFYTENQIKLKSSK